MNTLNRTDIQQKIQNCIVNNELLSAFDHITIYRNNFGNDSFCNACSSLIMQNNCPLVSCICMCNHTDSMNTYLEAQLYKNIEIFYPSSSDWENDIIHYLDSVNSKYICFFENDHTYDISKILTMVLTAEFHHNLDGIICTRNFISPSHDIIAHQNYFYTDALRDKVYNGSDLIEYCIATNINLYGNLSTLLISTDYSRNLHFTSQAQDVPDSMRRLAFLWQLLFYAKIEYIYVPLAATISKPYTDPASLQNDYLDFLMIQYQKGLFKQITPDHFPTYTYSRHIDCSKDITFFYTDKGEYYNLKPIADEAENRGYKITFTDDLDQKAEIGIYCQHINLIPHPEYSKFSVILLHDIGQSQDIWPYHWESEPWNAFDLGILPGRFWADFWSHCACQYYANPRCGVYELGYPKSDCIKSNTFKIRTEELRQQLHLKYSQSVLYSPSWENDGKEHDFVTALSSLNINLLVKHAPNMEKYPDIIKNIQQMRSLHEGKYENLYYIEPDENIMSVLGLCDIVVSDESNIMSEAVLFGKPSIAIMDWLIPYTGAGRFSCVPMDYIVKCKKSELRDQVHMLLHSAKYRQAILEKGTEVFSNAGNCCKDILDAIAFYTSSDLSEGHSFQNKKLLPKYADYSMWN